MSRTEKIVAMRKDGSTYSEIADAVVCSNQTVYQTLFRAGLVKSGKNRSKLSDEQKAEIVELRRTDPSEWTYMNLSVRFSCQPPTINKILRAAGLTKKRA